MKKIIGITLVLALVIPLLGQESKAKPDYLFWSLAIANLAAGSADVGFSLHNYRLGKVDEGNSVAKYMFNTCPWASPIYMLATTTAVIGACYLINQLGLKPLGHILLGGVILARGYCVYMTIKIASEY
jgi:hypothetical protein